MDGVRRFQDSKIARRTTDDPCFLMTDRLKSTNASSIGHPTAVVIGLDYGSEDVLCRHTEQVPQDRN